MTDWKQQVERLRFELRDWKPGDRFHFPPVNALTIDEAAATITRMAEALEGFNIPLRYAVSDDADTLIVRIPVKVIRAAAAALGKDKP